ncbi:MAG TPA: DUF4962 domain-containing protein [Kiritimatiellia bacterium]|nr:DUF4962 domain-containing protein [Kiritimatiellia bacterium]
MKIALSMTFFCLTSLAAMSDTLKVDNRPALPDEWGYRPADGSTAVMNPPSFTWIHDKRAAAYEVQWARTPDFKDAESAPNVPWCVYTHNAPLAVGTWHWRYRFATAKKEVSDWSAARSVTLPADAVLYPMPSRAEQRARLPQRHPRLFMRPEDLPRLRAAATNAGPAAALFTSLRKEADKLIKQGPTPEPTQRGSARDKEDDEAVKYWWPNRTTSDKAGQEAETLAFVWLITQNPKYGDAARKFTMALAAWDPDGPSNFKLNCEAGKAMLYHPVRAYDWAYDTLSEQDRAAFRKVWQRRAADAWNSGEVGQGNGHLTRPLNSHGNRIWHKLAEVGIALYGEVPEAETWLDYAVNKFYAAYPVWSDDDGGWHEGASYLTGYMSKVTTWMQVAHSALGIDGLKKPFFDQIGSLPLYVVPPNTPASGFGDLSYKPVNCGFLHYFARMKGADPQGAAAAAHWAWWLEQTKTKAPGGWTGFLYAANLPPLPAPLPPSGLPPSKIFRGTGVASLHDTLLDSRDDVQFLFKADPFGTCSHGHNAQLGFQLTAYGESLLPVCTYRDLHGSKFHYQWCHATRSQNAVLVNGTGQLPHSTAATGSILDARFTPQWDYVRGEATAAYTGLVTRAERAALFVKPDVIVLYDDFAAPQPATFQFMLHGLSPFALDEATQTLRLAQTNACLTVKYLAPQPLTFTQTDGFNPPPKMRNNALPFPNQWHVEAAATRTALTSDTLTVLVPARAGQAEPWTAVRADSATASGLRLTRNGRTIGIAFRKHGVAAAEWNGQPFDGPVLVTGQ